MPVDFDVGNQQMLKAGAYYQQKQQAPQRDGWQPIGSAPRDGTPIEIMNTYGVAPTYGLFRWTGDRTFRDQNGNIFQAKTEPGWIKVGDDQTGVTDGAHLHWRPFNGDAAAYIDPTGGAQNSPAYWRGAVAQKHGLPLDYFEKETAKNVAKAETSAPAVNDRPQGFWSWLFDCHK